MTKTRNRSHAKTEYSCIRSSISHAASVTTTAFLHILGREAQDRRGKAKDRSAQSLIISNNALWQLCRMGMGTQRSILPSKLQCSGAKFQPLHSSTTALPPCTPPAPDIPLHPRASLLEQGCPALASCHLVIKERRTWLSSRFFSSPQPEHTALVHRAGRGKTVKHWYFQH